jgi:hypothetical protein
MDETTRTTSRRSVLGRGLALVAGVVGLGATNAQAATPKTEGTALKAGEAELLVLYGRGFHLDSQAKLRGQVPRSGDRHSAYGELLDRPKGKMVGQFSAMHLTHDSPFAGGASSLEIHTFTLKDGTIHGLGAVARGAEGHFVILGGTGRYSGVTGSYVARQNARELGGNGTATFHMTLAS